MSATTSRTPVGVIGNGPTWGPDSGVGAARRAWAPERTPFDRRRSVIAAERSRAAKSRAPYNPSPKGGIRIAHRPTRAHVRARPAGDLRRHGAHRRPRHGRARPARPPGHAVR